MRCARRPKASADCGGNSGGLRALRSFKRDAVRYDVLESARSRTLSGVVKDNREMSRFELEIDGSLAIAVYRRSAGVVSIVHTEVPPEHSGKGFGSALARGALELVRAHGERVVPRCSLIAAFIRKHPEFQSLLAD